MTGSQLPRVLEAEVMDSPEDASDYDAMDHREVNQAFVDEFLAAKPDVRHVLDLGTGPGRIAIEVCSRHAAARVVGIDLAVSMLDVAATNARKSRMEDRIEFVLADAKQLPFADEGFTAVMSNSIVHHVADPRSVFSEAIRVVARGGVIFFRDLLRPRNEIAWRALVDHYAAGCNPHQRKLFGDSLRASLTLDEVRDLVTSFGYPAETVAATSDRHWTWSAPRR